VERLATLPIRCPTSVCMLCGAQTRTVGTRVSELVTSSFIDEATSTGIDISDLRCAEQPGVECGAGHRRGTRETRSAIAESRDCYNRALSRPGGAALHSLLLPEAGRVNRGRRRARHGVLAHQ